MNIITERIVTDIEAKEMIAKREKEGELKYEQKNAMEVLKKFAKADASDMKKLVEELKAIEKLRDKQIAMIANSMPKDKDDLRAILHKEYTNFSEDEIDKILAIVKKTA
jgi:DNA-directed RNA polymerase subunit F